MRAVLGDLGCHLQSYSIMRQRRPDHELRPDLKDTIDRLWVDISETDEKQVIDAVTIKSYTGNDPLTYREPHSGSRKTKVMNAKIWIFTNTIPKIVNYKDAALQDRIVVIDWYNTIPAENRDNNLAAKLTTDENRDRIATYFTGVAERLYSKNTLSVDRTFMFNIMKYFYEQGDIVVQFYDWLTKSEDDIPANPTNCISIWDLYGLFVQFQNNLQLNPMEKKAFEGRFSEIAKSDNYHFVKREKFTNGHFYRGILIPMQQRPWTFRIPANYSQAGYVPASPPPMQNPGCPPLLPPGHGVALTSPSTEPEDDEPPGGFCSSQVGGHRPASHFSRYIPS
jgi:phage/plasmid-associated DNA primase